MNAMILAAGRGTRLGRLGQRIPKVLLEIGGAPLLTHHLRYLAREGAERVVVNAHHLADQILAFADCYRGPLELVVLVEPEVKGTAGGARAALDHLGPDPFVLVYGDVVIDEPLAPMLDAHRREAAVATLAVYEADDTEGKGVVEVDSAGRVLSFVEKGAAGPGLVNAGLYVLEPELLARERRSDPLDFGHDVLPAALERGDRIAAHRLARPVVDVGTPAGLARARSVPTPGTPTAVAQDEVDDG